MANEVVKYKNELNEVRMSGFNATEMDLFFAICSRIRDREESRVRFTFDQLRTLSRYKPTAAKRFADDLRRTFDKLLGITFREGKGGVEDTFVLFTKHRVDRNEKYVEITINPEARHLLDNLESQFTRFELEEFTSIRGSYAKTLYRLLKQFKSTGYYKVGMDDFRFLLDVPPSYQQCNIDKRILEPALEELRPLYDHIELRKIKKKGRGRGGQVTHIEVEFEEKRQERVPLFNWMEEETR